MPPDPRPRRALRCRRAYSTLREGADARFWLRARLVACTAVSWSVLPPAYALVVAFAVFVIRLRRFSSIGTTPLCLSSSTHTPPSPSILQLASAPPAILLQSCCVSIGQHIHPFRLHRRKSPSFRSLTATTHHPPRLPLHTHSSSLRRLLGDAMLVLGMAIPNGDITYLAMIQRRCVSPRLATPA
ncbi:hypothetical protein DFH08DRAFT_969019 [Mycena albidolilacea]|uniref:Uncharacterized protein n=1 Tax=Mycena albidolilacea TaxID=1033008 RepID=A0AAD6ZJ71_9AGAR|nr:hypothetical protein DFH08DRAFT_969019 [Mycena albidolilacea]